MPSPVRPDTLLRAYPEDVQRLAAEARRCLKEWLPDAVEDVDSSARLLSYGHGAGYKGGVCTLILSKTGVKLGLVGGAALPDPHRLLSGSGKVHRHVQLSTPADLRQAGVKALVLAASVACRARLAVDRVNQRARR
jgi:hypothetical protein